MSDIIVQKFGGTSVGSVERIDAVAEIIKNASLTERIIVVVSAMTQVTNKLLAASSLAADGDEAYKKTIKDIENKHFDTIRELVAIDQQSGVIATIKVLLNQLEDVLNGVFLVRELSPKTSDYIVSFGESLSSIIISKAIGADLVDSKTTSLVFDQMFVKEVVHLCLTF